MSDLVALSFDFMTTHNEIQLILLQEALGHIRPELTAHASLADRPAVLQRRTERGTVNPVGGALKAGAIVSREVGGN